MYTSLDDILPQIQELWKISNKEDTKEARLEAKRQLNRIIQVPFCQILLLSSLRKLP